MTTEMTVEEVKASQAKLPCFYNCPKCKDKKQFKSKLGSIQKCREC